MMPKLDGLEVCRRLKSDPALPFIPIILVHRASARRQDVVAGLDAGADEYLTKPIDQAALVARVRSMLRIKALHDQVQAQADRPRRRWNRTLEQRVAEQVSEIERVGRLKRFLSPQIAELVVVVGRRQAAGKPPPRGDRRVLRSARLHRVRRDRRAGGGHGGAAGISRGLGAHRSTSSKARSSASPATA